MKSEEYQKGAADMLANIRALQALAKEVGAGVVWNKAPPAPPAPKAPEVISAPKVPEQVQAPQASQPEPAPVFTTFPVRWNEEPAVLRRYDHWCALMRPNRTTNTFYALTALGIDRHPTAGDLIMMSKLMQRNGKFEFVGPGQQRETVQGKGAFRKLRRTDK